jgi:hypothetical protein
MGFSSFEIKRGHIAKVESTGLGNLLKESFGNAKDLGGGKWQATLGPLIVSTWLEGQKRLHFETNKPTEIDDATATKVVGARNQFLLAATGFTTKERVKRAKKAVTGADE